MPDVFVGTVQCFVPGYVHQEKLYVHMCPLSVLDVFVAVLDVLDSFGSAWSQEKLIFRQSR